MDETLVNNFNSVVKKEDITYFLGDFSFGKPERILELLNSLNGEIYLLKGNHDKNLDRVKNKLPNHVRYLGDYYELKVQDEKMDHEQLVVLCHYPFAIWNKKHFGSIHLHAHSHGSLPDNPTLARLDVGVDCHDFKPISYETIKIILTKKLLKTGM